MKSMKREKSTYVVDVDKSITTYADMVYRIAIVQMKNKSDADDIFQDVFLRLLKYKDTIKGEEHLKAWLIRVTINCCKKHYDSSWNKKTTYLEEIDSIDEAKQMESENETLLEAVGKLAPHYKSVIHLFYYEEYSVKEIAGILEQSESTIKTRLSRARDKLRKFLGGGYDEERI